MSHHIYQTKAFIIDSKDVGEANKLLTLFTADLGLIFVAAQGVRVMKSKLRPSIQDLSFSKVALVKGKEYWRLTSAEKLISLYDKRVPLHVRLLMSQVLFFIKRLIAGESKHEELFEVISKLFSFCIESKDFLMGKDLELIEGLEEGEDMVKTKISKARMTAVFLIAQFRILDSLGYGSEDEVFSLISKKQTEWNKELIENCRVGVTATEGDSVGEINNSRNDILIALEKHIEKALQNSHL